jgi:hypothetical protein
LLFWDRGLVLSGTETFQKVASLIISTTVVARLLFVVLSLPLAVGRPGLRCVQLSDREAWEIRRFIARIVALGAASWITVVSLYLSWVGDGLPRLVLVVVGLVICAISLRGLRRIRSRFNGFAKTRHRLAEFGVIGLTMIWSVALLSRQLPPFWPVLLSVIILGGPTYRRRDGRTFPRPGSNGVWWNRDKLHGAFLLRPVMRRRQSSPQSKSRSTRPSSR